MGGGTAGRGRIGRGGSNGEGRGNATFGQVVEGTAGNKIQPIQERGPKPHQVYAWN